MLQLQNSLFRCINRQNKLLKYYSIDFIRNYKEENDIQERILKVAIIGTPNAGKSTLINNLMDRKVCATSSKVHTTRCKARAIFTEGDAQIIFVDTPGLVNEKETKRFNLEKTFLKDSKKSLHDADFIGVIHDASDLYARNKLDIKVIHLLEDNKKKPSFLVLNKVDALKTKRVLLDITRQLTGCKLNGKAIPNLPPIKNDDGTKYWPNFQEIFMVSALEGSGLEDIKNYLLHKAKPGKWLCDENAWSDQPLEMIIVNTVKAKFLNFLSQELPYLLKPELELLEINEQGVITTQVNVFCPTERIRKLIAGENDGRLKQIIEGVQGDLQDAFKNYVRINITLLVKPSKEKNK